MSGVITRVSEVVDKIKSGKNVRVKFIKRDGSDRIMCCTLDFSKIPEERHPKKIESTANFKSVGINDPLRVYDVEKDGWRSIPLNRLEWLSVNDKKYEIQLEEDKKHKFRIAWESGKTSIWEGETLEDAVSKMGYDMCVLDKATSIETIEEQDVKNVEELLEKQNNYIRGLDKL